MLPFLLLDFSLRIIAIDPCFILCDMYTEKVFLYGCQKSLKSFESFLFLKRCEHPGNPSYRQLPHVQMIVNDFFHGRYTYGIEGGVGVIRFLQKVFWKTNILLIKFEVMLLLRIY